MAVSATGGRRVTHWKRKPKPCGPRRLAGAVLSQLISSVRQPPSAAAREPFALPSVDGPQRPFPVACSDTAPDWSCSIEASAQTHGSDSLCRTAGQSPGTTLARRSYQARSGHCRRHTCPRVSRQRNRRQSPHAGAGPCRCPRHDSAGPYTVLRPSRRRCLRRSLRCCSRTDGSKRR